MDKRTEDLIKRIDDLIEKARKVQQSRHNTQYQHDIVDPGQFFEFRTATLSFFKSIFGTDHPYYKEFDEKINEISGHQTDEGLGILKAAKSEIENGWLISTRALISGDIFADFLEMAYYLLSENYKDAAAVMIGSVLEEHLRQLCIKNSIPLEISNGGENFPKKADTMNGELCKFGVYNKLDEKNITTQLDLRNKAAHGKYSEYTKGQVDIMYQSVSDFITRVCI